MTVRDSCRHLQCVIFYNRTKWIKKKHCRRTDKALIGILYKLRKQHKLSQSELERITGVSRISINRYENGKITPSVQAVNQLLVTMGYRLDIVPICDSEYEEMEEMQNEKKTDL